MTEFLKKINNSLIEKFNVKLYNNNYSINNIINDLIKNNINGEPFYLINLENVVSSFNKWNELLPNIKPYYAIKSNPNLVIIELLASLGVYFDCASKSEIKTIIKVTNNPSCIIFANPCKMLSHLIYAKENNVNLMTFDCEEELYKIKLYHPDAKLILRLAVDESSSICKFNKKFGCFIEDVEELLKISLTLKLDIIGFSFHVGSSCSSPECFYNAIETCKKAVDFAINLNLNINIIDIGGGFPGNDIDKFEKIAFKINLAIDTFFKENKTINFIAEPGRYFVEKSHILVLNIIGKKKSRNNDEEKIIKYYLNDGVYNSFNCILYDYRIPNIIPFNKKEGILYKSILFGPTCDSIDLISDNIMLPELEIGEYVYVENFGAYTIAASSEFNGIKKPINKYVYKN